MTEITTKIGKGSTKFSTLRTTIPMSVRDTMQLKEGDYLIWEFDFKDGLKVYVKKQEG